MQGIEIESEIHFRAGYNIVGALAFFGCVSMVLAWKCV